MSKLMITLNEELRTEFKLNSIRNKTNMNELIVEFIKKYNEEEKNK